MDWVLAGKLIYDAVLALSCVIAIRRGGTDERVATAIVIGATGATALVAPLMEAIGYIGRFGYFLVDAATLVAFDALMVRSRKFWPIWATGIQLAAVSLNIPMLLEPQLAHQFALIQGKFAYPILLSIVLGSLGHQSGKTERA